jgi:hypothetical protein
MKTPRTRGDVSAWVAWGWALPTHAWWVGERSESPVTSETPPWARRRERFVWPLTSDETVTNRDSKGFRVGDRSRSRYATPADFPFTRW